MCLALLFSISQSQQKPKPPRPPNILFILADDLGWSDTTLYGQTKILPNTQSRTTGLAGDDFYAGIHGQSALFADAFQHSHGIASGADGVDDSELSQGRHRAESNGRGKGETPSETSLPLNPVHPAGSEIRNAGRKLCNRLGYATGHFGEMASRR